jgi:hypothetical protein
MKDIMDMIKRERRLTAIGSELHRGPFYIWRAITNYCFSKSPQNECETCMIETLCAEDMGLK